MFHRILNNSIVFVQYSLVFYVYLNVCIAGTEYEYVAQMALQV